jgi:2-polyprenyl-3-methyl-5-hydroxy-6-metoxy-1,4-benzoquinol methylase
VRTTLNSAADRRSSISFDERSACPGCGGAQSLSLWSGHFSDRRVSDWLKKFHYDSDIAALGDRPFDLCECRCCGLKYHRFVISEASTSVVYGQWINDEQVTRFEAERTNKTDRFAVGVQLIKLCLRLRHLCSAPQDQHRPLRLLDFGCGNGEVLRTANLLGMTSIGIDISDSRRAEATCRDVQIYPDLATFDAADGKAADAVVLSQVLEHVTAPAELLKALRQRMNPNGILYVAVPDSSGIRQPQSFAEFHVVQPIEHINAFTPTSLQTTVCSTGFAPLKRPAAFVTSSPISAMRTAVSIVYSRAGTEAFFRRL